MIHMNPLNIFLTKKKVMNVEFIGRYNYPGILIFPFDFPHSLYLELAGQISNQAERESERVSVCEN